MHNFRVDKICGRTFQYRNLRQMKQSKMFEPSASSQHKNSKKVSRTTEATSTITPSPPPPSAAMTIAMGITGITLLQKELIVSMIIMVVPIS